MQKKYFIHTFGCQMNQADSEKIHMILLQSGFFRAQSIEDSDLVLFNTCSVRQKGEDRVFGMLHEIDKFNEKRKISGKRHPIIAGLTGCMVRKTGIAKRYVEERFSPEDINKKTATKIELLGENKGIFNYDDDLFRRTPILDFTLRIEETKFLPLILTEIYGEKIGQEDKFDDYLKQVQQRENPFSANIIIQTGCDNYCTFCIVPFTRGGEISRDSNEILDESRKAVASGAKEITLLGQNVNSYGKQKNIKLWNQEKSKWNNEDRKLKIGIDLDETLFIVLCQDIIDIYNRKFAQILELHEVLTYNLNGINELEDIYTEFEEENRMNLPLQNGAFEVLPKLKSQGHELFIITSREVEHKTNTIRYLDVLFGRDFFSEVIFVREKYSDKKFLAAQDMGIDIVIDDGDHHIDGYLENFHGKICIFNQNWNTRIIEDNKKTFRIHDWYDFEELLPKLSFTSPFRNLLEEIDSIEGLDRIRFTSSNPHDMTRDILDAHFDCKKTCHYLHFALQSGSNEMLKRMNRRHSYEDFRDMVKYLRKKDPLFSISTDIIVGFSGESDEMFQETLRAVKECQFDYIYIARYSVRPNTAAAKILPDDVPESVKAERWHILNDVLLECVQIRNKLMIGRTEEVMISGEKDEYYFGRTRNFKEVFFPRDFTYKIGDIVNIKISDIDRYVLKGEYI